MTTTAIAKRAGVSQATVSRVLNGSTGVSARTAEQVSKAMNEIGYLHIPRRGQKDSHSKLVATLILTHNLFHDYASTTGLVLRGAQTALQEQGIGMLLAHAVNPDQVPAAVREKRVDGLILLGHYPHPGMQKALADIPSVWGTSRHEDTGDIAIPGNEAVGRIAAEYLIQRGHTHIGILNTMTQSPAVQIRCDYFRFVAHNTGLKFSGFFSSDDATEPGCEEHLDLATLEKRVTVIVDEFLAADPRPTGLFVPMDMQVAVVYRVLAKRGITPGRDLEIIGSDDEKAALVGLYPRPATISIGPYAMGRRAVAQLLWRIANPTVKERVRVMVEPELVPSDDL